jgi:hypothetical protein
MKGSQENYITDKNILFQIIHTYILSQEEKQILIESIEKGTL